MLFRVVVDVDLFKEEDSDRIDPRPMERPGTNFLKTATFYYRLIVFYAFYFIK